MIGFFKILRLFAKTLGYYFQSLTHPENILQLKQKWAQNSLAEFGYTFIEKGPRPVLKSGLILVGNHISFLDIMVLMSVSPQITFVAKKEVKRWPVIGIAAARVGTIFVDRSPSADRKMVRSEMAKQIQTQGAFVTVFPSGTTSLIETKPWKKGIFEIAQEHRVPVQAFKLNYEPLRISAYIDDDDLITQMMHIFKTESKTVTLQWLNTFNIEDPQKSAEEIRRYVELA